MYNDVMINNLYEKKRLKRITYIYRKLCIYICTHSYPCPENTPMPNSKMTSEQRSKIYSLYLRAWTLVKKDASVEVPFIEDLTLTASQWESRAQRAEALYPESASFTFREAWKDFLHRVPAVSFRQIRNFMMAVIAEGRNYDRDDTLADAKSR